jgi:hypothetical protein
MFVDKLGILYIATYEAQSVVMYAPQYLANQSAGRQARTEAKGMFRVHQVKTVKLGI